MRDDVKQLRVARVIALMGSGKGKLQACKASGISAETFDLLTKDNPEYASDFVQEERAKIADQYSNIIAAQRVLIERLTQAALDPELSIKDALAIQSRLESIQGTIEKELAILPEIKKAPQLSDNQTNAKAEEFLKRITGPALQRNASVITRTTVTESIQIDPPIDAETTEEK